MTGVMPPSCRVAELGSSISTVSPILAPMSPRLRRDIIPSPGAVGQRPVTVGRCAHTPGRSTTCPMTSPVRYSPLVGW